MELAVADLEVCEWRTKPPFLFLAPLFPSRPPSSPFFPFLTSFLSPSILFLFLSRSSPPPKSRVWGSAVNSRSRQSRSQWHFRNLLSAGIVSTCDRFVLTKIVQLKHIRQSLSVAYPGPSLDPPVIAGASPSPAVALWSVVLYCIIHTTTSTVISDIARCLTPCPHITTDRPAVADLSEIDLAAWPSILTLRDLDLCLQLSLAFILQTLENVDIWNVERSWNF